MGPESQDEVIVTVATKENATLSGKPVIHMRIRMSSVVEKVSQNIKIESAHGRGSIWEKR